jgi:hypothetical protein
MTELSQTLTTDYRTAQGDYQRIQYIPVGQAGGALAQSQHIQLQVVQVAPVRHSGPSRALVWMEVDGDVPSSTWATGECTVGDGEKPKRT